MRGGRHDFLRWGEQEKDWFCGEVVLGEMEKSNEAPVLVGIYLPLRVWGR